jgi:hypothetical protein
MPMGPVPASYENQIEDNCQNVDICQDTLQSVVTAPWKGESEGWMEGHTFD